MANSIAGEATLIENKVEEASLAATDAILG
jgi:hypothetical protein